jgi:hypothetical protein
MCLRRQGYGDTANNPTASPSSTVVPVSVPPTLPVSFPSSKEEKLSGVSRGGYGRREKKQFKNIRWIPFALLGFINLYVKCGSAFASQYKGLVVNAK